MVLTATVPVKVEMAVLVNQWRPTVAVEAVMTEMVPAKAVGIQHHPDIRYKNV